jgi:hypothetical protein
MLIMGGFRKGLAAGWTGVQADLARMTTQLSGGGPGGLTLVPPIVHASGGGASRSTVVAPVVHVHLGSSGVGPGTGRQVGNEAAAVIVTQLTAALRAS